jgi:hypothetical protein
VKLFDSLYDYGDAETRHSKSSLIESDAFPTSVCDDDDHLQIARYVVGLLCFWACVAYSLHDGLSRLSENIKPAVLR